jgi:hypothetical protein
VLNESSLSEQYIADLKIIVDLTNGYILSFVKEIDPKNYKDNIELFISTSLSGPSMIAAVIIDKLSGTFHLDRKKVMKNFIKKLELSIKIVEQKYKQDNK